jgi:hypothetical protein
VEVYKHTATDDLKFRLVSADLWIRTANIHITSQACKYGDTTSQDGSLSVNDILVYEDFNLGELYFINASAGANTVVTANCIKATEGYKKNVLGV